MNEQKFSWFLALAVVVLGTVLSGWSAFGRQTPEPIVLTPDQIEWRQVEGGVRMAVLAGDPKRPGPFVLRLEYPAGYVKTAHIHPRDAYVTVLSGVYFRGYGTTFDKTKGVELTAGTFSVNPAGVSHFEWTEQPASLEVHAIGPWETVYVDAEGRPTDQPQSLRP